MGKRIVRRLRARTSRKIRTHLRARVKLGDARSNSATATETANCMLGYGLFFPLRAQGTRPPSHSPGYGKALEREAIKIWEDKSAKW